VAANRRAQGIKNRAVSAREKFLACFLYRTAYHIQQATEILITHKQTACIKIKGQIGDGDQITYRFGDFARRPRIAPFASPGAVTSARSPVKCRP